MFVFKKKLVYCMCCAIEQVFCLLLMYICRLGIRFNMTLKKKDKNEQKPLFIKKKIQIYPNPLKTPLINSYQIIIL